VSVLTGAIKSRRNTPSDGTDVSANDADDAANVAVCADTAVKPVLPPTPPPSTLTPKLLMSAPPPRFRIVSVFKMRCVDPTL
jgi:hypothetical protein